MEACRSRLFRFHDFLQCALYQQMERIYRCRRLHTAPRTQGGCLHGHADTHRRSGLLLPQASRHSKVSRSFSGVADRRYVLGTQRQRCNGCFHHRCRRRNRAQELLLHGPGSRWQHTSDRACALHDDLQEGRVHQTQYRARPHEDCRDRRAYLKAFPHVCRRQRTHSRCGETELQEYHRLPERQRRRIRWLHLRHDQGARRR